ncbi:reverse transcriptase N-terminal domain-containing protein [Orientia tsutsugamushi]|uniref:reverse transcriptase N-terminal domain-containing protein n=1 Tax=Orientia tsutsugamushi TaxID=784 RepID=UPI00397838CD
MQIFYILLRIVKVIQVNRYDKVKALQHLIANSFDSNVIAVRKVTKTSEKRIVGVNCLIQYLYLIVKHLTF